MRWSKGRACDRAGQGASSTVGQFAMAIVAFYRLCANPKSAVNTLKILLFLGFQKFGTLPAQVFLSAVMSRLTLV